MRTQPELTSATLDRDGPHFTLAVRHDERVELEVGLALFKEDELLAYWGTLAHEDFLLSDYPSAQEGIEDALGFVEQALTGRFEVEATYRGEVMTKATTFWIQQDGDRQRLATTGLLVFNPFRRRRRERVRMSFID